VLILTHLCLFVFFYNYYSLLRFRYKTLNKNRRQVKEKQFLAHFPLWVITFLYTYMNTLKDWPLSPFWLCGAQLNVDNYSKRTLIEIPSHIFIICACVIYLAWCEIALYWALRDNRKCIGVHTRAYDLVQRSGHVSLVSPIA